MLIAQGLGEYGALARGGASDLGSSSLSDVVDNIEYTIRHAEPTTWVAVLGVALVIWFLFSRTR